MGHCQGQCLWPWLAHAAEALADVADGFALLDLEEAVALRQAGVRQPILLLEGFFTSRTIWNWWRSIG